MPNKINFKNQLLDHGQRYVRAVMAERLRQEGFISRDGKDIHWYRVINREVVQTVCFFTNAPYLPIFLSIGYGSHPFFLSPAYPSSLYIHEFKWSRDILREVILAKSYNKPYDSTTLVTCPSDEYKGLDILEGILDQLRPVQTAQDCYLLHKHGYMKDTSRSMEQNFFNMSIPFMTEVIYWKDEELYPYCRRKISASIQSIEKDLQSEGMSGKKALAALLERIKFLEWGIQDENRDLFLAELDKISRREKKMLNKRLNIEQA